jgi:hypothetical protein
MTLKILLIDKEESPSPIIASSNVNIVDVV